MRLKSFILLIALILFSATSFAQAPVEAKEISGGPTSEQQWIDESLKLARYIYDNALVATDWDYVQLERSAINSEGKVKLENLKNIAFLYSQIRKSDEFTAIFDQYLAEIERQDSDKHRTTSKILKAFSNLLTEGDFEKVQKDLEIILKDKSLDPIARTEALILLSYAYHDAGETDKALAIFQEIKTLKNQHQFEGHTAFFIEGSYAYLLTEFGDKMGGIEALRREIDLAEKLNIPYEGQIASHNLTGKIMRTEDTVSGEAINALNQRIAAMTGRSSDVRDAAYLCGYFGLKQENYPQAIKCLEQAKEGAGLTDDVRIFFLHKLVLAYAGHGDARQAREHYNMLITDPRYDKDPRINSQGPLLEAEIWHAEGQYDKAFAGQRAYFANKVRDTQDELDKVAERIRNYAEKENAQQQKNNDLLAKQAVLQRDIIAKQRLFNIGGVLIALAAVLFSIFQVRQSRRLRIARNEAMQANNAKSEFLANMSHEIRTPMNGVLGMAEILMRADLPEKERSFAEIIHRSGSSLMRIINDILDYSKIEAGKMRVDLEPFDLKSAVNDVAALLGGTAREKNLELIIRYDPELPRNLIGDAGRIRQVLANLVGNAIKFTESGYVLVDITGNVVDQQANLHIRVQDTGIGIAPDKVDKIFDKFTQAETSTTRQFGGTGLGLSITQRLVELMQGKIGVNSELERGSAFWLKVALPVDASAQRQNTPQLADISVVKNKKIIVVDDVQVNLQIMQDQLSGWGLKPVCASNAKDALVAMHRAAAENAPFDLALLDIQMPDIDGLTLAKMMREDPVLADIGIVILSSACLDAHVDILSKIGVSEILNKPARALELQYAIQNVMVDGQVRKLTKLTDDIQPLSPEKRPAQAPAKFKTMASSPAPALAQTTLPHNKINLLVAEDNQINRDLIKYIVDPNRYALKFAKDGQEAVRMTRMFAFDMILMDISMPIMDGVEATRAIRTDEVANKQTRKPIIAYTAHALKDDKARFLRAGMDDFLAKPARKDTIETILQTWSTKLQMIA